MDIKVDQNTVVVFDLDDTLYNEIEYLKSAYRCIAQNIAQDSWAKLYAHMFSLYRTGENVFDFLIKEHSCDKNELLNLYRYHKPSIHTFPGVLELFQKIKQKDGKVAVITDGRSKTQRNKINSLGIETLVDHIVISEEIGSEKPNKNNFLAVENVFNRSTHYYIADNVRKDFEGPQSLGWQCILLADNGLNIHKNKNLEQKIIEYELDVILDLSDLRIIT